MRLQARIGVAASVMGVFGIGIAQGSRFVSHDGIFVWCLAGVLVAAALLLLRRQPDAEPEEECRGALDTGWVPQQSGDLAPPEYSASVFTRRYWGWVTLGCGVIAVLVARPQIAPAPIPAAARLVTKALPPPPPVVIPPPAPVEFPKLKLQGIHFLPSHPAAIINGKTYVAGDVIAGVKIVTINPDSVGGDGRQTTTAGPGQRSQTLSD